MMKKIDIKHVRTGDVCVNKSTGEQIVIQGIIVNNKERAIVVYSPVGSTRVKRWIYFHHLTGGGLFRRRTDWEIL